MQQCVGVRCMKQTNTNLIPSEHHVADPAVTMQYNGVLLFCTTIDHKISIVLPELQQFLHNCRILNRVQCGQRVLNISSQEILKSIINRCREHNFAQFRSEFVPFFRFLVFHGKRNGMEFGQRLQHSHTFVETEWRRSVRILETLQTQII